MSPSSRVADAIARRLDSGSGPRVATLFQKLLCLVFAVAFASLGVQLHVLVGSRGLLPIAEALPAMARAGVGFEKLPTLLWLGASDGALTFWWLLGLALSLSAFAGLWPRITLALLLVDYLSLSSACRTFCSFQWDLLLMETGALALFLPTDRARPLAHFVFRLLLFKLYFESGLAKLGSETHDWQDGTAMQVYYETAPLPGPLAFVFHHLPSWFHALESRAVLVLELVVPFAIFGPRRGRLLALVTLSLFQLLNLATANYGFFVYLSLALHLFLLDDADLARAYAALRRRWKRPEVPDEGDAGAQLIPDGRNDGELSSPARAGLVAAALLYVALSAVEGLAHFGPEPGPLTTRLRALYAPFRLVNAYHLFGSITRERVEVTTAWFDGEAWQPLWMRFKPGPRERSLPLVAPHQPRVDFQLWFYGLGYRGPAPGYVQTLVDRLCHDPDSVRSLFAVPLPPSPAAIRVSFARYTFTSAEERRRTGDVWHVEPLGALRSVRCAP